MNVDLRRPDSAVARDWKNLGDYILSQTASPPQGDLEVFLRNAEQLYLRLESPSPSFYQSVGQGDSTDALELDQRQICDHVSRVLDHAIRLSKDSLEIRRLVSLGDFWDLRRQLRLRPAAESSLKAVAAQLVSEKLDSENERVQGLLAKEMSRLGTNLRRKMFSYSVPIIVITIITSMGWITYTTRETESRLREMAESIHVKVDRSEHEANDHIKDLETRLQQTTTKYDQTYAQIKTTIDLLEDAGFNNVATITTRIEKIEQDARNSLTTQTINNQSISPVLYLFVMQANRDAGFVDSERLQRGLETQKSDFNAIVLNSLIKSKLRTEDGGVYDLGEISALAKAPKIQPLDELQAQELVARLYPYIKDREALRAELKALLQSCRVLEDGGVGCD